MKFIVIYISERRFFFNRVEALGLYYGQKKMVLQCQLLLLYRLLKSMFEKTITSLQTIARAVAQKWQLLSLSLPLLLCLFN